jgi:hypothetical protein
MFKRYLPILFILIAMLLLLYACSPGGNDLQADESTMEAVLTEEAQDVEDAEVPEEAGEPTATESALSGESETGEVCPTELENMFNSERESGAAYNSPEVDGEYILVTYQINGDEISSPKNESGVPEELTTYQEDTETHAYLWKFFTDIIPVEQRKDIKEFILFTDGADNIIGAVDEASTPNTWTMEIDIIDGQDLSTLASTLIHEFGHVLTLNDTQIGDNTDTCDNYLTIDGCSNSDSYINAFYNTFWTDIYEEWASTVEFSDGEVNEDEVSTFYDRYPDQFLTDYAPTGAEEDIAETWIYFIFSEKPAGDTIAEQKVLFFYDYLELVELRQEIRSGLCKYAPK